MSTTSTALMTAEEFMNLPDDDLRHELINGEVIAMPLPKLPHGRAAMRLGGPLVNFVSDHDLGEFFISEVGFQLTWNPDTVLGPDLSFISKERLKEAGEVEGGDEEDGGGDAARWKVKTGPGTGRLALRSGSA